MSDRLLFLAARDGNVRRIHGIIRWEDRLDPATCRDENGWNILHISCHHGQLDVVKYLIETANWDPIYVDKNDCTPLHHACDQGHIGVVKYLIETSRCNTMCADKFGDTPLQCACNRSHMKVVKYLIETAHCNPMCVDKNGWTPLHRAGNKGCMEVLQYLIETALCDPMCLDKNKRTPLHNASAIGHVEMVKYLLVVCHCSPNCKDRDGYMPHHLAVDHPEVVRVLIKAGAKSTAKLPQPPVKVFVVGNPSAGKTSLTKALQTETSTLEAAMSSITGPRLIHVSDVEQNTAGIVPCVFTSKKYGSVILYDFAGQQEYYASHAALLQNSISSSAPLFIIVVNLCNSEEDIKQKLIYWISFLANQCTSLTSKPHVIIVGSHKDVVKSRGEDPSAKVNMESLQSLHSSSTFHISKFIPMDCRKSNSRSILNLAECMKDSCVILRKQVEVAYHLNNLFTFLVEKFKGVSAVSFKQVLQLSSNGEEVPTAMENPEYLHSSCENLHDTGHIVYIKSTNVKKRWIVIDQNALLTEVNGVLFAPGRFKQHCNLANTTGVVPVSRLAQRFPQQDPDMLLQFLTHFEFCREITDQKVLQLITKEHSLPNCYRTPYLFFPGLVSIEAPHGVWRTNQTQSSHCCGWTLQCSEEGNYLTSRFLQVTILRVAFSCALAMENKALALTRKCSIWKCGIYWSNENGVEALVEIRDPPQNKEVVVMLRCESGKEVECACLRSTIIWMVLEAKKEFCHVAPTKELFLHPSQVREYPCKSSNNQHLFSINDTAKTIMERTDFLISDVGTPTNIKNLLLFEPYTKLGASVLQKLFSDENAKQVVSDRFLYSIAEQIYDQKEHYISMLRPSRAQLAEKIRQAPPGRCEEFVCVLQCWRGDSGTYQSLRETLDQFSVFAGRNPLKLASCPVSSHGVRRYPPRYFLS